MTDPIDSRSTENLSPGGYCAACGVALAVGARFCHRCGTPVGQGAPVMVSGIDQGTSSAASWLPWGAALVALVIVVAVIASKNSGTSSGSTPAATVAGDAGAPPGGAGGAGGPPPNIANMSASERASRLYIRIMTYAEAGKPDSVAFFAPMALAAHSMIENPSNDERYHYGRIAEVTGDASLAKAEADTILKSEPNSLLGLLLASRAARMTNDKAAASGYDKHFLSVLQSELARNLPDYEVHRTEIDRAAADARGSK